MVRGKGQSSTWGGGVQENVDGLKSYGSVYLLIFIIITGTTF